MKTNRTFVGLGTENKDKNKSLTSSDNQYIIYTDREYIPDMAPVVGTQSLYQLQDDSKEVSADKWSLHTDVLPWSCPPCRWNPSNCTTWVYKDDRDLKTNIVSLKLINNYDNDDENGINKITILELKKQLRTRDLIITGNKPELNARLVQYLKNKEALYNH